MANPFEKPIAARPQSTFVGLPLELMAQNLARRQQQYDTNQALVQGIEDKILAGKALQGDQQRLLELNEGYNQRIDAAIESAGGDYSAMGGLATSMARELQRDLAVGELGSITKNYVKGTEYLKQLKEDYRKQGASKGALTLGTQSLAGFTTDFQGENNTFSGYQYSKPEDAQKYISDVMRQSAAKFTQDGYKYKSEQDLILSGLQRINSDSRLSTALQEGYITSNYYNPDNVAEGYEAYKKNVIRRAAKEQAFLEREKITSADKEKEAFYNRKFAARNVAIPGYSGTINLQGASGSFFKNIARNLWDDQATKEFDTFVNSADGQRTIENGLALMPQYKEFPSEFTEQVEFFEDMRELNGHQDLKVQPVKEEEANLYVTDNGMLSGIANTVAITDRAGKQYTAEEINDMVKPNESEVSIDFKVANGMREGEIMFTGPDGKLYFIQPTDSDLITSPKYVRNSIDKVGTYANQSGDVVVNQNTAVGSNGAQLPQGTYNAQRDVYNKGTKDEYVLTTMTNKGNGSVYKVKTKFDSNNLPIYEVYNQKE